MEYVRELIYPRKMGATDADIKETEDKFNGFFLGGQNRKIAY